MKILSLLIVSIIIFPGFLSINENGSYINVNEYGYSILIGKNFPLLIINNSKSSLVFIISRVIISNTYDELTSLPWEKNFSSDSTLKYTMITRTDHSMYDFTFFLKIYNNTLYIFINLHISGIKGKSIGIIEHIFNSTARLKEINSIDRNMNYEFNGMPKNGMKINNARFSLSNGTLYTGSDPSSMIIFSPVENGNSTVNSSIILPIESKANMYVLDLYPLVGIVIGVAIIISGAFFIRKKS